MKILIDARMYGLEHAGIGRYVANLVREMKNGKLKIKNLEITLLVRSKNLEEIKKETGDKFHLVVADYPHYSLKEQIFLPLQLIKLKPNLVHFPHFNVPLFYQGKYIVTIHDLIKHQFRGSQTTTRNPLLYWLKYLGYKVIFSKAVRGAFKIIVPSQQVKNQLVKTYEVPKEKIVVTYEGVGNEFRVVSGEARKKSQKILEKYDIAKPFIIYTGSVYPHKNIKRLLQAIKLVNSSHFTKLNQEKKPILLVISCARSVFWQRLRQEVKRLGVKNWVRLAGFIPDQELVLLYQEAKAFVFPTLSEGFGLPGLEAMAAGLPVICSDIPVLREVYGEAAEYFDPLDVEDVAEKIAKLLNPDTSVSRSKMIKKGFAQVKKYSWEKMARETLKIYQ